MTEIAPKGKMFDDLCDYLEDEELVSRIIEKFGGRSISIPQKLREDHPLAVGLGLDGAQRLSASFGDEKIDIPRQRFSGRLRTAYVLELHRQGLAVNEIARRAQCTSRWVREVKKSAGR